MYMCTSVAMSLHHIPSYSITYLWFRVFSQTYIYIYLYTYIYIYIHMYVCVCVHTFVFGDKCLDVLCRFHGVIVSPRTGMAWLFAQVSATCSKTSCQGACQAVIGLGTRREAKYAHLRSSQRISIHARILYRQGGLPGDPRCQPQARSHTSLRYAIGPEAPGNARSGRCRRPRQRLLGGSAWEENIATPWLKLPIVPTIAEQ
jgi:hypothetical protein